MKNLLFIIVYIFSTHFIPSTIPSGKERTITGLVTDEMNEPLIFANVVSVCSGQGTQTDLDGRFSLTLNDTCQFIDVSYTGFSTRRVNILGKDSVIVLLSSGNLLNAVEITAYKVPLVEQDNTTQGGLTAKQIRNLPTKNSNGISAATAGMSAIDGGDPNIRGSRANALNYHVDGIKGGNPQMKGHTQNPQHEGEGPFHTEDYSFIVENEYHSPDDAPLSTFSVDVDCASYSNMRRYLNEGKRPPKDAVRIEELINYFDYTYPQPVGDAPIEIISEVGECPWAPEHKLVHIGIQGKEIPKEDLPASNLVFLIDVSGSMQCPDKLPLVISSFKLLVEHLRAVDRVAMVVYAGSSGLVLPSTSGDKKEEIIASLEKLQAEGSTAGAEGIRLAYEVAVNNFIPGGNNRVILATDGDFNVGVSSDAELVEIIEKKRETGVFLTVLGFGQGNYMDNKMQELADHGNGNHGYVDNITEAEKVFVHEFGGTLFTIAKDVKIQVEFNPASVSAYRLIGYENRMLQDEDFNNDKKDAGDIGSNHSVTALYEIIPMGVKDTMVGDIDKLKYQKPKKNSLVAFNDELMTVKFRYKDPNGSESKLIEKVVKNIDVPFASTNENFRFSAAVASFGMLVRESEFAGNATFEDVATWAADAIGEDKNGYRKEFLKMARDVPPLFEATAGK